MKNKRIALLAGGAVGFGIYEEMVNCGHPPVVLVLAGINREGRNGDFLRITDPIHTTVINDYHLDLLSDYDIDLGICAWWDVIPQSIVHIPHNGFINTHPSYLPFNKGKDPHFWALVEGTTFGVTLNKISAEIDSGDIIFQTTISTNWLDTGATLDQKAKLALVALFKKSFTDIQLGNFTHKQQHGGGHARVRAELEPASTIMLDGEYTGRELLNIIRGRSDLPGACFHEDGKIYRAAITITEVKQSTRDKWGVMVKPVEHNQFIESVVKDEAEALRNAGITEG